MNPNNTLNINRIVVLLAVILISGLFLSMVRPFLLTILLAGIFAGLQVPLFNRFLALSGQRRSLSAAMTLVAFLLSFILPLAGLVTVVATQAISLSRTAIPLIREQLKGSAGFNNLLTQLPFYHDIESYSDLILQKAAEYLGRLGSAVFDSISAITYSAAYDLFLFLIFCYTMFFFLKDGQRLMEKIQAYVPLNESDQQRLLDRFLSVTRATMKGSLVIALLQGSLAGLAFYVVGIESAVFWGTVMAVLSIMPLVGSPIIWIPATIGMAISGHYLQAAGLALFCSLVVGQIDNILRPILVGRDTQMHELFIFFGTLGGLGMFGIPGIIIGPVIAALFVTVWEIYGETFSEALVDIRKAKGGASE
ncbi:MAG: AI-2E family transporter [Chlorobiaceae bacterium]|nr:AI-2E family transporter [Chlorobiales bacterium]NTU92004.1 AI-2E family transporter [Chlorobiaceae bacterium]